MTLSWLRAGALCVFYAVLAAWLYLGVLWSFELYAAERPALLFVGLLLPAATAVLVVADLMRLVWAQRLKAILGSAGAWAAVFAMLVFSVLVVLKMLGVLQSVDTFH